MHRAGRRRRRRRADPVLPREERGARDLGRLSLRPRRRARDVRLRRGAIRSRELDATLPELASDRPALYTPLGLFEPWDRRITQLLNDVRARVRTGVSAPDEVVDVRGVLDAHAPRRRTRTRSTLMRRAGAISQRRAPARDGAHASRLVRVPGRGRAAARVPALRRAGGGVSVDRRLRARTRACCTIATTTARCATASCS